MKDDWKKELARDFIALGGIPFFILVVVRIWLLDNNFYLGEIAFAGILFLLFAYLFKFNYYSGFALISLIFTGIHYADIRYWIFASLVYLSLLGSLVFLEKKKIYLGILVGGLMSGIGYLISNFLFRIIYRELA